MAVQSTHTRELLVQAVELGRLVREAQLQGQLASIPPPTIESYRAFYDLATALPHVPSDRLAECTLLGHATGEDAKQARALLAQVFGLEKKSSDGQPIALSTF